MLTAPVEGRSHHASCALQCQGHEHFGIENSGLFCFCLSAAEALTLSLTLILIPALTQTLYPKPTQF